MKKNWREDYNIVEKIYYQRKYARLPVTLDDGGTVWLDEYYRILSSCHYASSEIPFRTDIISNCSRQYVLSQLLSGRISPEQIL